MRTKIKQTSVEEAPHDHLSSIMRKTICPASQHHLTRTLPTIVQYTSLARLCSKASGFISSHSGLTLCKAGAGGTLKRLESLALEYTNEMVLEGSVQAL